VSTLLGPVHRHAAQQQARDLSRGPTLLEVGRDLFLGDAGPR
jgi:hypothetical protein